MEAMLEDGCDGRERGVERVQQQRNGRMKLVRELLTLRWQELQLPAVG
jgi:hypothetical protein